MKRDPLAWAALAAALVVTASAEYALARAAGFGQWTAAGVPAALDIYAVRAMRARRDVAAVVTAMILVNAAAHMVEAGLLAVSWPLVVGVSAIAPLVLWRLHRLAEQQPVHPVSTAVPVDNPGPVELPAVEAGSRPERQTICGAHRVFTLVVPPVPDPPTVNTRLSAEQAREVIEAG